MPAVRCFSALQRAENSSICACITIQPRSRQSFSALQRAENSSIKGRNIVRAPVDEVSVLFSEPKIPQLKALGMFDDRQTRFSALQRAENSSIQMRRTMTALFDEFQCSSASRKFLNGMDQQQDVVRPQFQCSSASRKFLNVA